MFIPFAINFEENIHGANIEHHRYAGLYVLIH